MKKKKLNKLSLGPPVNLRPAGVHKDQHKKKQAIKYPTIEEVEEYYSKKTEADIDKLWNILERGGLK